jgi:hypothetical protein
MRQRWCAGLCWLVIVSGLHAGKHDESLRAIKSVGREGAGNDRARQAWNELVSAGPAALAEVFEAFQGADAIAANWLRNAVEAIVEKQEKLGRPLPASLFEAVVTDRNRSSAGRELAFEILDRLDPAARDRLLPRMLDEPSAGLRREAIEWAYARSPKAEDLAKLFALARDVDQVERLAKDLKALGREPDVLAHLGLITRWQIAGPFDNAGLKGYAAPLPDAVTWKDYATGHERAVVNLYQALGLKRGVDPETKTKKAIYALVRTEVESPIEQAVEVRAATPNAIRIWLNGHEIFAREEYHHGMKMDQHVGRGVLKPGRNEILAKICQDDRTFEWTLDWVVQLRICDSIGGAVPFKVVTAPDVIPEKPQTTK